MSQPRQLGKYKIVEEIGRGGFAAVYRAVDTTLDREVALKVLAPHLTWDPTFVERFRREARATAQLRHPNIVIIYEVDESEGQLYIAMEYLSGCTLTALLEAEGAMEPLRALTILEQVADALDYAHQEGVIHRDVKPSNIMVATDRRERDHATLMDFGLVKAMATSKTLTSIGTVLGSPEYMAPEQADPDRRDEIGPPSDRYALGVVAYEMLTGQVPFPGNTPSTLVAHMQKTPPDPRSLRGTLPMGVTQALLRALSKPSEERFPTALTMVEALRAAIEPKPKPERVVIEPEREPEKSPAVPELEQELYPALTVELSGEPEVGDGGARIDWTIVVRNTGDSVLHGLTSTSGGRLITEPERLGLGPGEGLSIRYSRFYGTTGNITEEVSSTAIAGDGQRVSDRASAVVNVPPRTRAGHQPGVTITEPLYLELVRVPAGEFLMGSGPAKDPGARDHEQPQRRVYLPEFYIGRYPVTNGQYSEFVKATGHRVPTGDWTAGWQEDGTLYVGYEGHAVEGVSWHDATAFCQWLTQATGRHVRLPTEAEWEKAARGPDGWIYPWGDGEPDPSRGYWMYTSAPVGWTSPQGDSPYGCQDMVGAVWQWTQSLYKTYPYDSTDGREDPKGKGARVVRGGSRASELVYLRCAHRSRCSPDRMVLADTGLGFRVCVVAQQA